MVSMFLIISLDEDNPQGKGIPENSIVPVAEEEKDPRSSSRDISFPNSSGMYLGIKSVDK